MSLKQWIVCSRTLETLRYLLEACQWCLVVIFSKPFPSLEMDHVNKLFVHASQDHLYSTTPSSSSSPKTCALQTIRTQQSLSLHNFSLTLDLERTCLLMEILRYPLTSASMSPPFSHSSSTYTHLSSPILLSLHTSSIACSLPQGMRMYMSSTTTLLTCSMHHQLKPGCINWLILPS